MDFSDQFDLYFSKYKNDPIIVYGLGDNARKIFSSITGYNFCAVTAKDHFGEKILGRTIIPIEEAVKRGKILIIAAMPNSTNIIYARIKKKIPDDFPVFDIRGHRLNMRADYKNNPCWEASVDEMKRAIEQHDVISFDVFDTLITRRVLYPQNIFEIVERKLSEDGIVFPFACYRIEAEKKLSCDGKYPTLSDIYDEIGKRYHINSDMLGKIMTLELKTEKKLVRPRSVMVEILKWAKSIGKTVILTSDMYLPIQKMQFLLSACGIHHKSKMFISCECKASKADGKLYEYIKKEFPEKTILHIGDNDLDDKENAKKHGWDAYGVMSPLAMLCASSISHIVDDVKHIDDCIFLGHVLADVFSNPFELHSSKGKISIRTLQALTEMCFCPITMRYMQFILQIAKKTPNENMMILFSSRDGYFLQKLYHRFYKQYELPRGIYFYVSRQAATGAMIQDEHDIDVLCSDLDRLPIKNLKKILEQRFQVEFSSVFDKSIKDATALWGKEGLRERIYEYKEKIFASSARKRQGYLRYFQELGLNKEGNIYLVDLITRGTGAYALKRMLGCKVHLISCFGDGLPNEYISDIHSCHLLFGNIEFTSKLSGINQILEIIYASDEGQLTGFLPNGEKLFELSSCYNGEFLCELQKKMFDFLHDYADEDWWSRQLSNEFVASMLDILHGNCSDIVENVVAGFDFYDPLEEDTYFNAVRRYRMSECSDRK